MSVCLKEMSAGHKERPQRNRSTPEEIPDCPKATQDRLEVHKGREYISNGQKEYISLSKGNEPWS